MPQIPRDKSPDSTISLLREGYTFISKRCRRYRSDVFETRLMLERATCMMGEEAAEVFYRPDRFTRQSAMPQTALRLLQDQGSVQLLDGEDHRRRKALFMSLMGADSIRSLTETMAGQWLARMENWEARETVVFHDEAQEILCRAVCEWAGILLSESEAQQRTREFAAMIEGAGSVGPHNWRGHLLRRRTEQWAGDIIEQARSGALEVPEQSAVHAISRHRDRNGEPLEKGTAAVELLNVLRPTVAVARYVTFAALALHAYPECRRKLAADEDGFLELFVQEVRRFYPFFPFIGGRVREEFDWREIHFPRGRWVILDLYGTNHDPRLWDDPEEFHPERFRRWSGGAFDLIPQGGGDHYAGHRCAGEWLTIGILKRAVRLLAESMRYDVPEQDLSVSLSRMPAIPRSGFVISGVRRA